MAGSNPARPQYLKSLRQADDAALRDPAAVSWSTRNVFSWTLLSTYVGVPEAGAAAG